MTDPQQPNPQEALDVEATPSPEEARKTAAKETADKAREEYLAQTAPTREGQSDDDKRFAAYDRTYLRFIEGTTASTSAKAKDLAKALGHSGAHIETRPV